MLTKKVTASLGTICVSYFIFFINFLFNSCRDSRWREIQGRFELWGRKLNLDYMRRAILQYLYNLLGYSCWTSSQSPTFTSNYNTHSSTAFRGRDWKEAFGSQRTQRGNKHSSFPFLVWINTAVICSGKSINQWCWWKNL